jgi:hypothetical protein
MGYSSAIGNRITHEGFASDDILISQQFEIRATELLPNPSDHTICFAELTMPADKAGATG